MTRYQLIYDLTEGKTLGEVPDLYDETLLIYDNDGRGHVDLGGFCGHQYVTNPTHWNTLHGIIKDHKLVGDDLEALLQLMDRGRLTPQAKTNLVSGIESGAIPQFTIKKD